MKAILLFSLMIMTSVGFAVEVADDEINCAEIVQEVRKASDSSADIKDQATNAATVKN